MSTNLNLTPDLLGNIRAARFNYTQSIATIARKAAAAQRALEGGGAAHPSMAPSAEDIAYMTSCHAILETWVDAARCARIPRADIDRAAAGQD